MKRRMISCLVFVCVMCLSVLASEKIPENFPESNVISKPVSDDQTDGIWMTDYSQAVERATKEEKLLLIFFTSRQKNDLCRKFESDALEHQEIKELMNDYILLKLSLDEKSTKNPIQQVGFIAKERSTDTSLKKLSESDMETTQKVPLLKTPEFSEMQNLPGIAIVDYKYKNTEHYGQVVSVFPFLRDKIYNVFETKTLLTLPPGTVTQRSLIYAVRTHPEKPKSTNGELNENLKTEAESHSLHQAKIRLQGHHNWNSRFQKISARLPGGLWASEVCAESWPNQGLLESAIECVHCWRLSSGHWSSVVAEHPYYGYDMKRGSNGIWYATGIFGKWKPGYSRNIKK